MNDNKIADKIMAPASFRALAALAIGIIAAVVAGTLVSWKYAPLVGWDIAAIVFLLWLWTNLWNLDAKQTSSIAVREELGRDGFDLLLVIASLASLGAVGVLLFQSKGVTGLDLVLQAGLGFASVLASWAVIHSIYALKYASLFFKTGGGINFNDTAPPRYSDFAYLAFTLGMTFQVSDTTFTNNQFRRIALRHSLLSYLFGTVVVAATINLLAGLGK